MPLSLSCRHPLTCLFLLRDSRIVTLLCFVCRVWLDSVILNEQKNLKLALQPNQTSCWMMLRANAVDIVGKSWDFSILLGEHAEKKKKILLIFSMGSISQATLTRNDKEVRSYSACVRLNHSPIVKKHKHIGRSKLTLKFSSSKGNTQAIRGLVSFFSFYL